ncbi:transposase [Halonotius terrestris]|uniref:Transposase n=1 Tax=Halonotius terrestris TaxID=2487750 RepID=A0A8J8PAH2_9EURY|nr:RNA-guided endonuclease TnpB family protein [Halonotius terrestris]TQQ78510.1 transposase [Halonotius terrestris]
MTELTKTLELKLVDPNAHKREKLRETRAAYQQALQEAFDANCSTLGEANDIVGDYHLSGYAKNALKRYVPQLTTTYGANELSDDHPVRFTNEGVKIDHKPENTIKWYVKIPHHEDYHLWVPAQPNPEQRDWLEAVIAGDADVGEGRLLKRKDTWYFHLIATRDIPLNSEVPAEERTPIGVDIGEASLVTVCHRDEHGSPTNPELWTDEGKTVRRLRKRYFTTMRRLQSRESERIADTFGDELWAQIDDILHTVTREVVEYAESVEAPVLVLEDLTYIQESMDYGDYMNRRLHGWGFAKLHAQITYKAVERGIPVATVDPRNTSQECHACGEGGTRPQQATFKCSNDACWIEEYQADINAALNIADRYLSGESRSREHENGDDSAEDGASLTGPQDSQADAETQQATLGMYAS